MLIATHGVKLDDRVSMAPAGAVRMVYDKQ